MRRFVCGSIVAGALLLIMGTAGNAYGDSFNLTWTGGYGPGSATLTATNDGGGEFTVTGLSGLQNGVPITFINSDVYGSNDNAIFQPPNPDLLDLAGLGFFDGTNDYNLFLYGIPGDGNTYTECNSAGPEGSCEFITQFNVAKPVTFLSITPVTSTVPEPASMVTLLLGTLAVGLRRAWNLHKLTEAVSANARS
jgi:hypothetical protein